MTARDYILLAVYGIGMVSVVVLAMIAAQPSGESEFKLLIASILGVIGAGAIWADQQRRLV
jgi:hypothetical protein